MRAPPLTLFAIALALALVPAADAQSEHAIAAGEHVDAPVDAQGRSFTLDVVADAPIDIVLLRAGQVEAYYAGNATALWSVFNNSEAHATLQFPNDPSLVLVLDNTATPTNGAPGTTTVNATLAIQIATVVITDPAPEPVTPVDRHERPTLWNSLMFTATEWDIGPIGLAGVALWLTLFCVAAAIGFKPDLSKLGVLVAGTGALAFLWALLPHPGIISLVGLPLLIGAGVGYVAAKGTATLPDAVRLALLASVLGAILGLVPGHYIHDLWSDQGHLVLGGDRFLDALFLVPVAAVATAALAKFIPAFVAALEDEDREGPKSTTQQAPTFTVSCIRCATPITVNRSLKRYRVKTDHIEFACPNCNTWMEWATPKAPTQA